MPLKEQKENFHFFNFWFVSLTENISKLSMIFKVYYTCIIR